MSETYDESCPISRETVQIVDDCPDSLEKWKKAAQLLPPSAADLRKYNIIVS